MICRITELRNKEVINSNSGCRIGYVDDVEIDTVSACVRAVIIYGRYKCFGLLGKCDEVIIPWSEIELIGEDTILISTNIKTQQKRKKGFKLFV